MPEATTPDVDRLMSDYVDLRNGDLSKLDVLSDTFTFHLPIDEVRGRDAAEAMQREQEAAFPDFELTVDDMLADDDIVMWEWTVTGTHRGEWQGIPPTGREVAFAGMSKTVISEGKIQENWAYFDSRTLMAQLEDTA
ncbi:ester cyclase [Natrononativus amylolyticus]|uniref:ester cyclase n=1 Tax=Natrononativus amylolyticus TaxID=2963434 RepID=UPI0020CD30E8|nr:ester cyclase [Natrononativus amylolyticus]